MEGGAIPMEKPYKLIRRSIYIFLQNYQYFTLAAALLALPFSASTLLSQVFTPSSPLLHIIRARLHAIFMAAGFPNSDLLSLLGLKLSQSILTASCTFPWTLSFLLIAKAYTIKSLTTHEKPVFPSPSLSFVSVYISLAYTYICSAFVIIAANATAFLLLFLALNFCEGSGFSSPNWVLFVSSAGAVAYSIILANVLVICNLALVISGTDRSSSGFVAMLKACVLVSGKTSTALLLALPVNMLLASVEGLFQYRIIRGYHMNGRLTTPMAFESVFIAYLYSILLILDIIISCVFFKACRRNLIINHVGSCSYRIDIKGDEEEETAFFVEMKETGVFP